MQQLTWSRALVAPLALLLASTATAQQGSPAPAEDTSERDPAGETRELEGEIEQYPESLEPAEEPRGEPTRRIPERVEPAPPAPRGSTSPTGGASSRSAARAPSPGSAIDPAEVQRVFGSDAELVALDSLDAAAITRMQLRLRELGHYRSTVDGVLGPQTRAALRAYAREQFELEQRLLEQKQITSDLAQQLGVDSGPARAPGAPSAPSAPERRTPPVPPDDLQPWMPGDPGLPRGTTPLPPRGPAPLPPPGVPPEPSPSGASPSRGTQPAPATPAPPPPP